MTKKNKIVKVPNISTGEIKDINEMTEAEISFALTDINAKLRKLKKLEKAIKDHIKANGNLEFDDNNSTFFGEWRVKRFYTKRFSQKLLDSSENERDQKEYNRIKDKYSVHSETIKFG